LIAGRTGESLVENGRFEAAEQACRNIEGLMIDAMAKIDPVAQQSDSQSSELLKSSMSS